MSFYTDIMTNKCNIYSTQGGILNLISQREQGNLSNLLYRDNATNIKVKQLPKLSECTNIFSEYDEEYYWFFLRSNSRGEIIGVCSNCRRRKHSSICVCKFTYASTASKMYEEDASINARPFIKEITKTYQILRNIKINDTADLNYRNQKPLLLVGTVRRLGSVAILTSYHCDNVHREYEWRVSDSIFCCASELNSENFALGCSNGFYICKNLRLSKKYNLEDHVVAAEFNDNGNLLFISRKENGIQVCDMRENLERSRRNLPPYFEEPVLSNSSLIAHRMKLLSDQVSLIVSDRKGCISKVDLRMKKSVFQYPGHECSEYRRPLNLDEDLDLLCAVGDDNCCRIWSLSSGKVNWVNNVSPSNYEGQRVKTLACIVSSERRWFVAVVQNDTVIPIVPTEAEMVTYQPDIRMDLLR